MLKDLVVISKSKGFGRRSLGEYLNPRILSIGILGFSSGIPLLLTAATLGLWLKELGLSLTSIGLFALTGLPYVLKFLWAPFLDHLKIPFLTAYLGRRRAYMVLTQVLLILCIGILSILPPLGHLGMTAIICFGISFLNALQEITILAYQVESLKGIGQKAYGPAEATGVFGYRMGMLVSSAGVLYLSSCCGWTFSYLVMTLGIGLGLLITLLSSEPEITNDSELPPMTKRELAFINHSIFKKFPRVGDAIYKSAIVPFKDFMKKPQWRIALVFMLTYRMNDYFGSTMSKLMYLDLGFSLVEIANVTKVYGMITTILGGFIGGWLLNRVDLHKSLILCGIFHCFGTFMYVVQVWGGYNLELLYLTIGIEHATRGMAIIALFTYQMTLVNVRYSATQLALLTSFTALGRVIFTSCSGIIADQLSWNSYFVLTTLASFPGIALGYVLWKQNQKTSPL